MKLRVFSMGIPVFLVVFLAEDAHAFKHPGFQVSPETREYLSVGLDDACRDGTTECAEDLFQLGADPYYGDENTAPLVKAAANGMDQFIEDVLIRGPSRFDLLPQWKKQILQRSLNKAALAGHQATVEILLNFGVPLNGTIHSHSPLSAAIAGGQFKIALFLLEKGADPDSGRPLSVLVYQALTEKDYALKKYREVFDALIKAGANPNLRDEGYTPLEYIVLKAHYKLRSDQSDNLENRKFLAPTEFVIELLKAGAKIQRLIESFSNPFEFYADDRADPDSCDDPDTAEEDSHLDPESESGFRREKFGKEVLEFLVKNQKYLQPFDWALVQLVSHTASTRVMPFHRLIRSNRRPEFTGPPKVYEDRILGNFCLDVLIEGVPKCLASMVYYPYKWIQFKDLKKVAVLVAYATKEGPVYLPMWRKDLGNWGLTFKEVPRVKLEKAFDDFVKSVQAKISDDRVTHELVATAIREVIAEWKDLEKFPTMSQLKTDVRRSLTKKIR